MTAKASAPMPEGVIRPTAPRGAPRKKSKNSPGWLITLSKMKACSYCGTVVGPCLSEENCPHDNGLQEEQE